MARRFSVGAMKNWPDHFCLIQLRRLTLKDQDVLAKVADGTLRKLTKEIAMDARAFADLPPWDKATARAAAVGLTADTAVVAGPAAARLWGIDVLGHDDTTELLLPGSARPGSKKGWPPGVVYRSGFLHPDDIHSEHGIRVTRLIRTLADIARHHTLEQTVVAVDSARRLWPELTLATLDNLADSLGPFHRTRTLRQAIALSRPEIGSALESQARFLLWEADLPGVHRVETQAPISMNHGITYRVDLLINGWLVVEVDGEMKYRGAFGVTPDEAIRRERRREKEIQNLGYVVLRISAADLRDPAGFLTLIADTLANTTVPAHLVHA